MKKDKIGKIYSILEQHGQCSVGSLAKELNVSESTIRRYLTEMEDNKMVRRHYGTAEILGEQIQEKSLAVRDLYNSDVKKRLAAFATTLIKDGDVVYIDGGTTTSFIADFISNKNILVVTQAINVFERLMNNNVKCFAASGYLKKNTSMIIGTETISQLSKMHFSIAFLGGNSIHPQYGFSASDDIEASLKNVIIHNSSQSFVVADSSKVNILTVPHFAELDEAGLITDKLVDDFNYSLIPTVYYMDGNSFRKYSKENN